MEEYCGDYDLDMESIKRRDPFVEYILAKSKIASVFLFDTETNKEIDCNIHGECYIYNRNELPYFAIQVSNQEQIFLREAIVNDITWDMQDPMILYNKGNILHSIMFHNPEDFKVITVIFTSILDTMQQDQPMLEQASSSTATPTHNICPLENEPNILKNKKLGAIPKSSGDSKLSKKIPISKRSSKRRAKTSVENLQIQIEKLKVEHKEGKPVEVTPKSSKFKDMENLELPSTSKTEIPTLKELAELKIVIKKLEEIHKEKCLPFSTFVEIDYCGLPAADKPKSTDKPKEGKGKPAPELQEVKINILEDPSEDSTPEPINQSHAISQSLLSAVSNGEIVRKIYEAFLKSRQEKND